MYVRASRSKLNTQSFKISIQTSLSQSPYTAAQAMMKGLLERVHCSRIHSGLTQQPEHLHAMCIYTRIIFPERSYLACNDCREKHMLSYTSTTNLCCKHTHLYYNIILYYAPVHKLLYYKMLAFNLHLRFQLANVRKFVVLQ